MIFTGKNILIVGTGISGMGALKALSTVQANCILYDGNERLTKEDVLAYCFDPEIMEKMLID